MKLLAQRDSEYLVSTGGDQAVVVDVELGSVSAPRFAASVLARGWWDAATGPVPPDVMKVLARRTVQKYDPDQPRAPKGTPIGGQWVGGAVILGGSKVGGQGGSNPGGSYKGTDGKVRYVKFYKDPIQGHGEHLANQLYLALGLGGPQSEVFTHEGKTAYASEWAEGYSVLSTLGVTKERARAVLDGFAADILTGNWDAVGLVHDNVLFKPGAPPLRIDNGGTFLFRAQAGRKPEGLLNQITEWEGFAPGGLNPAYGRIFKAAGETPASLRPALKDQVAQIVAVRDAWGGWDRFVTHHAPTFPPGKDRQAVVGMLDARTRLLQEKVGLVTKYSPDQPRVPAGSEDGGQWAPMRGMSGTERSHAPVGAEGSEAFQRWFAGSKIVDAEGRPLRLFHGTQFAGHGEFETPSFFTTSAGEAAMYSQDDSSLLASWRGARTEDTFDVSQVEEGLSFVDAEWWEPGKWYAVDDGVFRLTGRTNPRTGDPVVELSTMSAVSWDYTASKYVLATPRPTQNPGTYAVYLAVKNPIVLPWNEANHIAGFGNERGKVDRAALAKYRAQGYDGIVTQSDQGLALNVIPFDPRQIKSAIGSGYDPTSPDIAKYRPDQPRAPKGSEEGGQWVEAGTMPAYRARLNALPDDAQEVLRYNASRVRDKHGAYLLWKALVEEHAGLVDFGNFTLEDFEQLVRETRATSVLSHYVGSGHRIINHFLRHDGLGLAGHGHSTQQQVEQVQALEQLFALDGFDITEPVFRGVDAQTAAQIKNLPVGAEFVDKGFVSTANRDIHASDFSHYINEVIRISFPRPARVLQGSLAEGERILMRGARFRRLQDEPLLPDDPERSDINYIDVEYLGSDPGPIPTPHIVRKRWHMASDPSRFVWQLGDLVLPVDKEYNPNQPRHPKGVPEGGQWAPVGPARLIGGDGTFQHPDTTVIVNTGTNNLPPELFGVPFAVWKDAPQTLEEWLAVEGQNPALAESELLTKTYTYTDKNGEVHTREKHLSAGVIVQEPDGRVWIVEPRNHFGGYHTTFPKGSVEEGMTLQQTAIKETYEESGLKVRITGVLGDYERDTSIARYYRAERVGGDPRAHGWESQSVRLVPVKWINTQLNRHTDRLIAHDVLGAPLPPAPPVPKYTPPTRHEAGGAGRTFWDHIKHIIIKYSPDQERAPKGTPIGGQWVDVLAYAEALKKLKKMAQMKGMSYEQNMFMGSVLGAALEPHKIDGFWKYQQDQNSQFLAAAGITKDEFVAMVQAKVLADAGNPVALPPEAPIKDGLSTPPTYGITPGSPQEKKVNKLYAAATTATSLEAAITAVDGLYVGTAAEKHYKFQLLGQLRQKQLDQTVALLNVQLAQMGLPELSGVQTWEPYKINAAKVAIQAKAGNAQAMVELKKLATWGFNNNAKAYVDAIENAVPPLPAFPLPEGGVWSATEGKWLPMTTGFADITAGTTAIHTIMNDGKLSSDFKAEAIMQLQIPSSETVMKYRAEALAHLYLHEPITIKQEMIASELAKAEVALVNKVTSTLMPEDAGNTLSGLTFHTDNGKAAVTALLSKLVTTAPNAPKGFPEAPVVTGTSAGPLWAANKITQLTSAAHSSDPVNAILAVSITKTTPKYIIKYRDDLLAYVKANAIVPPPVAPPKSTQPGPAAQGTAAAAAVAAAKPKMPPLPPPPPANPDKYTPEQVALYNEKIAALQKAALGPNPLVAIDTVQGASGSIQTYKSALINHLQQHAPLPDAIVGTTLSTYKIVADGGLTVTPPFPQRSHGDLAGPAQAYRDSLPSTQQSAVSYYQGSGYHALNAHRFNPGAALPSNHVALDKALAGYGAPFDMRVIRNISSKSLGAIAKSLEGKVVQDPAYMSSSLHGNFGSGSNVQLRFNVPKGTRGLYLSGSSGHKYEEEFLMARNTRFRIWRVEHVSGKVIIHADVLPLHEQLEVVK